MWIEGTTEARRLCSFLASVEVVSVARSIGESVGPVADARRLFVRFTRRPFYKLRRVTVFPARSSISRGSVFDQPHPVIVAIQQRSVYTSQNVRTITIR